MWTVLRFVPIPVCSDGSVLLAAEPELRDLSRGGGGFGEIIPVRISFMLQVQIRAALQQLKSVQKPELKRFLPLLPFCSRSV